MAHAVVLPDGKVLIAGGVEATTTSTGGVYRPNAEIFDPVTNSFASSPPLAFVYSQATATRLLDNRDPHRGRHAHDATGGLPAVRPGTGNLLCYQLFGRCEVCAHRNAVPTGAVLIVGGNAAVGLATVPAEIYESP